MPARLLRMAPDERLVTLVRDGSEPAFEALYERHHRGILAFCRHMLGSAHEAEDAVQHAFLAAYRDLVASEKPIVLRPWLYAVARNRCLSILRGRRERPASDQEVLEVATEGLGAQVQRRQDLRELLVDLRRLPEEQRGALVLAELGDLSHEEIAAVIGVRKEKVKALVFQARESLAVGRQARETPCAEVREELATARGAALRRAALRRHLSDCAGCREFSDEVKRQRRAMAAILPVIPTAGLKAGALPWIAGGGGAAGGGLAGGAAAGGGLAAGGAAATGAGGLLAGATAAKVLAVLGLAGATAGGVATVHASRSTAERPTTERAPQPAAALRPPVSRGAPGAIPVFGAPGAAPAPGRNGTQQNVSAASDQRAVGGKAGTERDKQPKGKRPKAERDRSDTAPGQTNSKKDRSKRASGRGAKGGPKGAGGSKGGGQADASNGGSKGGGSGSGGQGSGSGSAGQSQTPTPAPAPASDGSAKPDKPAKDSGKSDAGDAD